eukprot:gnl/TRDRNA2_/TRDRNA2_40364_c0_seq1.p1 gnl/TRDRNA2_/TRDRNA2_40364_c0~~gnl/TRDRNA2_/TRDRNA2_40364_c0_seq1.p1  ORF type:complete len:555 (+),score=91.32 gnl/TRDRNA2_/TRDRNA2_40364_c0_seq1:79-1665(+)
MLSDEVLRQLCTCLPGRDLLRFAASGKQMHELASASEGIWRYLTHALLGEPFCHLHVTLAGRAGEAVDTSFWRKLFRQGQELRTARWSSNLRTGFWNSAGEGDEDAKRRIEMATMGSGHCTVGIGNRVVKTGGLRPHCRLEHLHAAIFDLTALTVREVELTPDSDKPERRLRHAACEIRPALTGSQPAVLVLGGCHDRTKQACQGGLQMLHILEIMGEASCSGRWRSVQSSGEAPTAIWHHICGSFAAGKKVVVFGGDFKRDDPEFQHIEDRSRPANLVYVLDVDAKRWDRTVTSGTSPTWRSLHTGFTHLDVSSHSERLVVLGGCAAHLPIFSSSDELQPMYGHALDLRTMQWLPQTADVSSLPPARLRLACEKVGEWLLLYGGHGEEGAIGERVQLHKLNLRTLRWGSLEVRGREGGNPAAAAATMTAGLVLGGVKFTMFGISTIAKLDVLTLNVVTGAEGDAEEGENAGAAEEPSDDEDGSNEDVAVVIRDASGNAQRVALPRALLAMLMARRGSAGDDDDDEES